MNSEQMFSGAKWVRADDNCASPYFRKDFTLNAVTGAQINICGLGFFELYINGKKVSDDLLVPSYTQYEDRDLSPRYDLLGKMGHHTYVCRYDVTDYLQTGKNALAVRLGKGWYDRGEGHMLTYGKCKLCFALTVGDTLILSDQTVKWKPSDITYTDIYYGERINGNLTDPRFADPDTDISAWNDVTVVKAPDTEFEFQTAPADKIIRSLRPVLLRDNGNTCIYDVKEGISGYAEVRCLRDGDEITVQYADALTENGELDFYPSGKLQQEIITNGKKGAVYHPRFCWHAFRYIKVSSCAELLTVRVVHSDCPVTSGFTCDNEVLNWLYTAYIRTQLDNMHCGIPSDCPHIERHGYTGDGQLCAPAAMLLLDSKAFYRKWMRDIADCQDRSNGHVQHTAPFVDAGGGPAAWGGAIINVPYYYYKAFGETDVLERYFPNMLLYINYMVSRSEFGLVYKEEQDWCLGDWCAPTEYLLPQKHIESRMQIPETYVNTALFVKLMKTVQEIAQIIGKTEQTAHLASLIQQSEKALEIAYYSPMTKDFCGNVQGANAFAVDIGLGGEETLNSMNQKYERRGQLDTGIVATDLLPRLLFENGFAQTAFDLLSSRGDVSFGYMMEHGATTLWEDWHPERSLNHPMFGAAVRYLFIYLLGIKQTQKSAGYQNIIIEPKLVKGLNRASGFITTVKGKISVAYEIRESKVTFWLEIPFTDSACFVFNGNSLTLTPGKHELQFDR